MSTIYVSQHAAVQDAPRAGDAPRPVPRPRRHKDTPESRFRADIEGLRAVAVLLVVAYHAGVGFVGGGYVGVDVFFVISGFLITTLLFRELKTTGKISLAHFYARRALRLLPASAIVVAATVAAAWHWMPPLTARDVSADALWATLYGLNFELAREGTDYLGSQREPSPLQHFWSLAVEEQFYLVWPVVLFVASLSWLRRGRPSVVSAAIVLGILGAGSLGLCIWLSGRSLPWAYFGSHARAWELAAGALVALAAAPLKRTKPAVAATMTWLGLAAVVCSALVYTDTTLFPGYAAMLPVGGAALLIAGGCASPRRGAVALLRLAPLQELGRLSYSWYLWHWPVLVLAPHVMGHTPNLWTKLGLMVATLVPASMSLAAVENRIRFHRVFRRRARHGLVLGAAVTAVVAAFALVTLRLPVSAEGSGTVADTGEVLAAASTATEAQLAELIRTSSYVSAMPGNLVPPLTSALRDFPRDGNCIASLDERSVSYNIGMGCENRGDPTSSTTVVLFGDSHAEQWFEPLQEIALQRHWRLVVFAKGGCTPAMASTYKGAIKQPYVECAQWRAEALRRIGELRPAMVVISSRTVANGPLNTKGPADAAWTDAWMATARAIRGAGAAPVFIQDTPLPPVSVPDCISTNPLTVQRCNSDPRLALNDGRRRAIADAAVRNDVRVIDPAPWFCTATACPAVVGNTLVYRGNSHVTATYMKLLAPMLAARLS